MASRIPTAVRLGYSAGRAASAARTRAAPAVSAATTSRRWAHTTASGEPGFVGDSRTHSEISAQRTAARAEMPALSRIAAGIRDAIMGTVDRSTADRIPRDDRSRYRGLVTRFDTRPPDEILRAGGFRPRGTGLDFERHQQGGAYLRESGLISASRDVVGAESVRERTSHGGADGFMYEFDAHPHDSFRLDDGLAMDPTFEDQREVAIAGPVDWGRIRAATDTRTGTRTEFPSLEEDRL